MGIKLNTVAIFCLWLMFTSTATAHIRSMLTKPPADAGAGGDAAAAAGGDAAAAGGAPAAAAGAPAAGGPGGIIDIVANCGAKENADVTQAVQKAWADACAATSPSIVKIPTGVFKMGEVELCGPCKAPITFQLDGTLKAPSDPGAFKKCWVAFSHVDFLTVCGTGTLDGCGQQAWASKAECTKTFSCKMLPYNIRLDYVKHACVTGITSQDSKNFHVNVLGCENVTFTQFKVVTPADSANTDGIHVGRSNGVNILDTHLSCGDDCVSIGDGTVNLKVEKVICSPGHGLSIGSLGKYKKEEAVSGIHVKDCTIENSDNGVRLKSWPGEEPNTCTDVIFDGITMNNVSNPIILDQNYCPWNQCKKDQPTKVKMSNIAFKNIKGTAACPQVVQLICSPGMCENVELCDIDLKYDGPLKENYSSICCNVKPKIAGTLNPPGPTCV